MRLESVQGHVYASALARAQIAPFLFLVALLRLHRCRDLLRAAYLSLKVQTHYGWQTVKRDLYVTPSACNCNSALRRGLSSLRDGIGKFCLVFIYRTSLEGQITGRESFMCWTIHGNACTSGQTQIYTHILKQNSSFQNYNH